ncbi:MAG: hypothetical protein JO307_33485 [Bryobacterales bacterium]|nr:hypothetical protein [Bryobacterales bacterium]
MKVISKLGLTLALGGALSYGATWRGAKLLDASCYDQNGKAAHLGSMCAPSSSTTNFAFKSRAGKVYRLDSASNEKAMQALENGVIKPNRHGDYRASITGKHEKGNFVMVRSIIHDRKGTY